MMGTMMQDLAFAIPGVDEAMSFAEIMKYVTSTLCAPRRPCSYESEYGAGTSSLWNTL